MHKLFVLFTVGLFTACGDDSASTNGSGRDTGNGTGRGDASQSSAPAQIASQAPNAKEYLAFLKSEVQRAMDAGAPAVFPGTGKDLLLLTEMRALSVGKFWGPEAQKVSRAGAEDRKDPLPAILDFDRQMKEAGIDWILLPVPAKLSIQPELLPNAPAVDGRIDNHQSFFAELAKHDVPCLDLTDALRGLVASGKRSHCMTDAHWSGHAVMAAAKWVKARVGEPEWWKSAAKTKYTLDEREIEIKGDLRRLPGSAGADTEMIDLTFVQDASGAEPEVKADSKILVMGDSHCLVFHSGGTMHSKGAGFADHLAHQFRMPVDVVGVRGSGATPSRLTARRKKSLDGKKLVVWCFTVREFTEGRGWAKVPMFKE